jgi:serine/threonine protein kinase/tetratricopeptide (TPR) repeat protein
MPPQRWQQVQNVLADAIASAAADRVALLDARCGGDTELRREVESLLAAHEDSGMVDELAPLVGSAGTPGAAPMPEWSGRRVTHYVVQEPLGAGGMGVVYKAHDERLGRHVALKFLPPHLSADPEAKSRFVAEARAAAALDHPNVCTIFEIGETEDGQLFLAMPLYDGETLRARLDRGRLAFDDALPIVLQVARGLGHAHDAGIVHRDVKPSNIVVLPDGTAKILDFGIAQIHDRSLADPRTLVGTISYMSPEQASVGPTDVRSDIWSLGVVIHEMLAGARPFHGGDAPDVLGAILTQEPDVSATSYPDVPGGMERILRKALAKAPDQRYGSMALLAADLSALLGGRADAPAAVSTTERRRAAVLVSLVSEYASLVDQMTPAEAHRLVGLVRDTAVDVVRAYGGLVNQAIGDEVISVFGVPVTNEDDDLRAVRAALDLHARIRALQPTDLPPGIRLTLQSGLHVGPVVARRLNEGPRRYDIVGAPAAAAARLAALADRDAVWISAEAQRLVAPYMQTTPCAPVVLDSQAGPVTPFCVQGETGIATRLDASSRTGLTPYVGRQAELSFLQSVIARSVSGAGGVVAVVGEPGVGKSRLLYELQRDLAAGPEARVLSARCMAYGDRIPYGVFVQIVCAALKLELPLRRGDDVVTAVRALDPSLDQFLPLLLHLLSVSSTGHTLPRHLHGEHLQAALLDALAEILGVLVARGPVCVLVEDWHWADSGSRAAFLRVAELADSSPLVLIVTSRLDLDHQGGWPPGTTRVQLEQLDLPASAAIMRSVLRVGEVSEDFARRLYDRAGGNPFFLEQMCGALLEQGESALSLLPDTVQGVIRARLDNLDPQALDVARVASVIGWEFDHALLAGVVSPDIDLGRALAALEAAGVVQQTSVSPTVAYRFTHALKQEVCYESLVGHQRKRLHGAIGRALASGTASRIDEAAALLAHHFARAEEWSSAIRFGRRAAERAIALSQFADALSTVDHMLDWVGRLPSGEGDDLATDLLFQQERLCETLGLRARQQQIIDLLIARLARDGSSARLAEVYLRQGDLSTLLKRFDAADRALSTALRIGQEQGDNMRLRSSLRSLGLLRWHEGRHEEALEITRRALALDRECDDAVAVALDLTNLGSILRALGDYQGARVELEAALAMPALRRDPKKWVYAQHNLANVYRSMDDLDRALECLIQCDEVARAHLLPIQRSFHLTSIAHIHLQQGRIDAALETYHAAVDLSRRARHAEGLVQSLRMTGNALLGLTRYEEALPYLREAAQLFAQLDDPAAEAEMWTGVARILERGSADGAADAWNVVLSLHRRRGDAQGELDAREGVARALRASGHSQAVAAYESALALALTIGDRSREVSLRNVLGILEWERAQYDSALNHYEAALAVVRGLGRLADEAVVLNSLGACLTKLGRHDEARTVLEESLAISRRIGVRQIEAHALAALGRMSLSAREPGRAVEYFGQAASVAATAGDEKFSAACADAARAAGHS